MNGLFISASHKSSGKTTVTLGLARALKNRSLKVQTYKKGPDYIDPMWLAAATQTQCLNLDFHTMGRAEIKDVYAYHNQHADISLIEGNKGLFDGVDLKGADSNAAMAQLLGLPVILVMDTRGMTRGIAPLILGYQAFDPAVQIAGVLLNQVGGPRHEKKLRSAIEHYTDIPVLGAIGRHSEMQICERHLGLIPANEISDVDKKIDRVARIVEQTVDLNAVIKTARLNSPKKTVPTATASIRKPDMRIAVPRDKAFGFYYPDDLTAFLNAGAELVFFDTFKDPQLPECNGLFIGGGFPEMHMPELQKNRPLRQDILQKLQNGMPAYAECGGLMYLTKTLSWQNGTYDMVGFIPADTVMHDKPVGRGYVQITETGDGLWQSPNSQIPAHEFHYASLQNLTTDMTYAYDVVRGHGIDGHHDGLILNNLTAGFIHQRSTETHQWVKHFTDFVRLKKYV